MGPQLLKIYENTPQPGGKIRIRVHNLLNEIGGPPYMLSQLKSGYLLARAAMANCIK